MKKTNVALAVVMLAVFIDMLGLSIILPIIPFLAIKFKANSQQLGYIYAGYAGAQMVSTPITGYLSDKLGRRPLLIASLIGSVVGFMLQAVAEDYEVFVVGRVLAGLFGGSMPIAQAFIADATLPKNRPRYFAMLGSVVTVAFMFGPGIGAGLSQFTLQTPMFVSAGIAFLGLILAIIYFREPPKTPKPQVPQDGTGPGRERSLSYQDRTAQHRDANSSSAPDLETSGDATAPGTGTDDRMATTPAEPALTVASKPDEDEKPDTPKQNFRVFIYLMYLVSMLMMLSFSVYIYFFGILLFDLFGWGSLQYGFVAMGLSIFSVVNQMTSNIYITKRFGKHACCIVGLLFEGVGILLISFLSGPSRSSRGAGLMVVALVLLGFGYSLANPACIAVLSRYGSASSQGSVMGIAQSLQALARTVGPILWGALYGHSRRIPFIVAAFCAFAAAGLNVLVLYLNRRLSKQNIASAATAASMTNITLDPTSTETVVTDEDDTYDPAPHAVDVHYTDTSAEVAALRAEIARLRERLAQYERLERLIGNERMETLASEATSMAVGQ